MRKIIIYIFFASVATIYGGCYDDKGNYTYTEITEVRIDTAELGILPAYAISRFDTLTIAPDIYYDGMLVNYDESTPLEYLWTIYAATTGSGIDYTVDTLGRTRVLKAEISRAPDVYYVRLTVKNKENGLETYFYVQCNVEGDISEGGWMVLYERADMPGYSDVGLVVNSFTKKNLIQDREYWNLYGSSNGGPLEGAPVRISHTINSMPNDLVVMVTEKSLAGLNKSTFTQEMTFSDFFYEAPETQSLSAYIQAGPMSTGETLVNDNKLYYKTGNRTVLLGVPMMGDYGELSPWLCLFHRTLSVVAYDQTNHCFLYVPYNDVTLTNFTTQSSDAAFDVNDTGSELLFGDWGRSYYEYLLMKDSSSYHLAVADFYTSTTATVNVGKGWYDMTSSPGISNVSSMAASYTGLYVIYGSGNSVYNFQYSTGNPAEVLWTAPSEDEEVTCVRLQKYDYIIFMTYGYLPNANSILHISTWNEKTKEGKLYQYAVNPASGTLEDDCRIYTVPGKVKDMGWKYVLE